MINHGWITGSSASKIVLNKKNSNKLALKQEQLSFSSKNLLDGFQKNISFSPYYSGSSEQGEGAKNLLFSKKCEKITPVNQKFSSNVTHKKWWKESVVYQIYPRSFNDANGDGIGDLRGVIEKLDYLKELGANIIWLNPVYKSPNEDNGYDISDYHQINPEFGTMQDWDELINGLHARGMKLVMDVVVNHTSSEHPWFQSARSSKNSPYRDYYIWRSPKNGKEPNNWLSMFGGSAWEYDKQTGEYYLHTFAKGQPDLNWANPKLRQDVYTMMKWWLDKGVDGFRLDAIDVISKREGLPDLDVARENPADILSYANGPHLHQYLKEMHKEVFSKFNMMTVAEWPAATPSEVIKATSPDAHEVDMVFNFDHMYLDYGPNRDRWNPQKIQLKDLKKTFTKWQKALDGKGWNSIYLTNHDHPRAISRFGTDKEPYREASGKMLATLMMTLQGTPYIYMGEEIGMTNPSFARLEDYNDISTKRFIRESKAKGLPEQDILRKVQYRSRDNSRTPMQWSPSLNGGFSTGVPWLKVNSNYQHINVKMAQENPNSLFYYYQKLIKLRKEQPSLIEGKYELLAKDDEKVFAYTRILGQDKILVILNFSQENAEFFPAQDLNIQQAKQLIGNYPSEQEDLQIMRLKPYEARIYKL